MLKSYKLVLVALAALPISMSCQKFKSLPKTATTNRVIALIPPGAGNVQQTALPVRG